MAAWTARAGQLPAMDARQEAIVFRAFCFRLIQPAQSPGMTHAKQNRLKLCRDSCVEGRMCDGALRRFILFLAALGGLAVIGRAAEVALPLRDELIYADGDRVRGELVRREGDVIVFRSVRFGELRVNASEAQVVVAEKSTSSAANANAAAIATKPGEEGEMWPRWYQLRPLHLTRYLSSVFGSWHGRLAMSTEVISDASDHSAVAVEGSLRRKWKRDEAKISLRYDYYETERVTSTDMLKGDATWNHSFGHRWYSLYHPTVEWNRSFIGSGAQPTDYLLLQQEIGLGLKVYETERGRLSVGLSENIFDVWVTAPQSRHQSRGLESAFAETEWKLPWQITLTDRGIVYYSSGDPGWENRFQIDKKLTETFSIGVSHELRYNNPDVRVSDYSKLKVMLGVDF
jgi:hypothetical protein